MEQRVVFTAGALIRGDIISEVRRFLFLGGADFTITEDRGWIESDYYVTIRGENSRRLANTIRLWVEAFNR